MKGAKKDLLIASAISLVLLVLFYLTCSRTVGLVDSGELSAVAWTLGIAHPTGYPLWTLLAFAWSHIMAGLKEPVFAVALMSSVSTAVAGGLVFLIAVKMGLGRVAGLISGLCFGLARLVWATSISAEVYALGGLLVSLFLLLLVLWQRGRVRPHLVWYTAGLVMANHLSGLSVVLPGLTYMIYRDRKTLASVWAGFLALSIYGFLPIRSLHEPFFDWGDPQSLNNFFWHITGHQYRVWMFSSGLAGLAQGLKAVMVALWHNWNLAGPAALVGMFLMRSRFKWVLVSGVGLSLVYLSGYNIPDIGDYFVPLFVIMALGLAVFLNRIRSFAWLGLLLVGGLAWFNFKALNRRGDSFVQDVALLCLESARPKALILCNYWDMVSPMLYLQQVKGIRKDVIIIDKELLRRSWYLKHIRVHHQQLYCRIEPEMTAFSRHLALFEHGKAYDPALIQNAFVHMLSAMMLKWPGPSYLLLGEVGKDEQQLMGMSGYRAQGLFLAPVSKELPPEIPQDELSRLASSFNAYQRTEREKVLLGVVMRGLARQ